VVEALTVGVVDWYKRCAGSNASAVGLPVIFVFKNKTHMATKSVMELVKEAKQNTENLTPAQVKEELSAGNAVLIDIREADELQDAGKIEGSVHAPRGLLEFYADPSHSYHKPEFDREKRIILHCASGGRSALAAQTLKQMGYTNVAHLDGGIKSWKDAGMPVS
jgi:rhodanese-related sulfurtransferase